MKTPDLAISNIVIEKQSDDTFGRVLNCHLDIVGQLRIAMVTARRRISTSGVDLAWELRTTSNKLLGTAFMDSDDMEEGSTIVECLLLNKQALLLERVTEESLDYYRIGVAELLGLDQDDDFFTAKEQTSFRLV